MKPKIVLILLTTILLTLPTFAQDYFYGKYKPFNPDIPTPEEFLGREVGEMHTRHDLIVAYLEKLAEVSDRATISEYGRTHEMRKLVMLTVSAPENLNDLENIKQRHLAFVNPNNKATNYGEVPIFVQLGYNVHGNEASSSEAAMLTAYTLVASEHPDVMEYINNGVIFIDPTINPDGRDRHTQWVNQYQGNPLVSDNVDAEHTEMWPRGRTNHYWFDLNRDWLLAINPESRGKLNWYHEWYPNVVTDFHEMGTNSTYFFEPMKPIGSLDPIMPEENYGELNDIFAPYFENAMNEIGSLYFTKEAFDGTYPGYGSSYPDLQGALALLFEQARSGGHVQDTDYGKLTFPFTIRNQYVNSMATVQAAVENKERLREYQQEFFESAAFAKASKSGRNSPAAYEFGDPYDQNRTKAFIDKLLIHRIKTYKQGDRKYVVPVAQAQKRMVQTMFETYEKYRDSVYYDASAWSVANFYNMEYKGLKSAPNLGEEVTTTEGLVEVTPVQRSNYAYLIDWDDYNTPAVLAHLQQNGLKLASAFKPFSAKLPSGVKDFNYGTLMLPVSKQDESPEEIFEIVQRAQKKFNVPMYGVNTGFSAKGIDLGSRNFQALEQPKAMMLIGDGVNSYEAGEVWHLLDTRVHMPITKLLMDNFSRADLNDYNTIVMVSGNYSVLDSSQVDKIKDWVRSGNTLIATTGAAQWAINKEIISEKLIEKLEDTTETIERKPYVDSSKNYGKEEVGGAIFEVDLDLTHPVAFGYRDRTIPVYKNNEVFLRPSKSAYNTVAKYTEDPHIDGFISEENMEELLKPAASIIVSGLGSGRVVLFADNPNFRGSWYGTNRLFLNALFLGSVINAD